MRHALAILLMVLLFAPCIAKEQGPSVKQQVLTIARDRAVEVRFLDHSRRKGRLGAVNDSGFELQSERQGKITVEQVPFETVEHVKELRHDSTGRSVGRTLLITGIVVGTVFGVAALIVSLALVWN